MIRRLIKSGLAIALVIGLATFYTSIAMSAADDNKTPAKDPPAKLPDYSKYKFVKEQIGEVLKFDDKKITIRVKWTVAKGFNPLAKPVEMHKDYEYQFIPESLVRTSFLPKKTDDKGKRVEYTQKEKDALKMPVGVTGYAASMSDITLSSTVNLILIRDKTITEAKATEDDLRIKFAIIQPPMPPATPPAAPPNKN